MNNIIRPIFKIITSFFYKVQIEKNWTTTIFTKFIFYVSVLLVTGTFIFSKILCDYAILDKELYTLSENVAFLGYSQIYCVFHRMGIIESMWGPDLFGFFEWAERTRPWFFMSEMYPHFYFTFADKVVVLQKFWFWFTRYFNEYFLFFLRSSFCLFIVVHVYFKINSIFKDYFRDVSEFLQLVFFYLTNIFLCVAVIFFYDMIVNMNMHDTLVFCIWYIIFYLFNSLIINNNTFSVNLKFISLTFITLLVFLQVGDNFFTWFILDKVHSFSDEYVFAIGYKNRPLFWEIIRGVMSVHSSIQGGVADLIFNSVSCIYVFIEYYNEKFYLLFIDWLIEFMTNK